MPTPHPIVWTPASIIRFWECYSSTPGMDLWHFSKQRGKALLRLVEKRARIEEPVLDLGCGLGHLLDLLLKKGYRSFGADINQNGLDLIALRSGKHPAFLGCRKTLNGSPLPFDDSSIGTVFLLETVEHLLPGAETALFAEIRRILKPGGLTVITAPWREDLEEHSVTCAACGVRFHQVQHVRSLDEEALSAIMTQAGMRVVSCKPELLLPDPGVWIRAQMVRSSGTVKCPECGAECRRGAKRRLAEIQKEMKHLVGIGSV